MNLKYREIAAREFIKAGEGFRERAYWDVDAWRIGYGSDTITKLTGDVKTVIETSVTTREEALNDLDRRLLNEFKPENWDRLLYKVIKLQPGNWDTGYKVFVEFIKIMAYNWSKSIPELLKELEDYDVGIDKFFLLERGMDQILAFLI